MLKRHELQQMLQDKATVYGSDGEKIGTLGQIYLDDETGIPSFATVHTGLFGAAENFVPLEEAEISGNHLYVKFSRDFVKNAPRLDPGTYLGDAEEERLYDYYAGGGDVAAVRLEERGSFTPAEHPDRATFAAERPRLRKYVLPKRPAHPATEPHPGRPPQDNAS